MGRADILFGTASDETVPDEGFGPYILELKGQHELTWYQGYWVQRKQSVNPDRVWCFCLTNTKSIGTKYDSLVQAQAAIKEIFYSIYDTSKISYEIEDARSFNVAAGDVKLFSR